MSTDVQGEGGGGGGALKNLNHICWSGPGPIAHLCSSVKVVATDTLKEPPMGQQNKRGPAKR